MVTRTVREAWVTRRVREACINGNPNRQGGIGDAKRQRRGPRIVGRADER